MVSTYVFKLHPDFIGKVVTLYIYPLVIIPVVDVHMNVFFTRGLAQPWVASFVASSCYCSVTTGGFPPINADHCLPHCIDAQPHG